jgi:hypothetical protein
LRFGLWPESTEPAHHHVGLTVAARRLAESALEELGRLGVVVTLDEEGRARFRPTRILPHAAKLAIERQGDVIEALLIERALRGPALTGLHCSAGKRAFWTPPLARQFTMESRAASGS